MRTGKDEADRAKIDFQIKAPPPWQKKPTAADRQKNAADFTAAMNSLQGIQGTGG